MDPTVTVEINTKTGAVTWKVSGVAGQGCYAKMKQLQDKLKAKGLDINIEHTEPTNELYQTEIAAQSEKTF